MLEIDYTISLILKDPAASGWIKEALRSAVERDPVDAVNDAAVLLKVLRHKLDNVMTVNMLRTGRAA